MSDRLVTKGPNGSLVTLRAFGESQQRAIHYQGVIDGKFVGFIFEALERRRFVALYQRFFAVERQAAKEAA